MVDRHQHAGVPLTAVFLDVDHFKLVNDKYGHGIGDEVLRSVARIIGIVVRDSDTAIRYGGEEILCILPSCDEPGGQLMAERARQGVAKHDWTHYAPDLKVTVSLGVATQRPGESLKAWIARADQALYAAKHRGRNRVVLASELTDPLPG